MARPRRRTFRNASHTAALPGISSRRHRHLLRRIGSVSTGTATHPRLLYALPVTRFRLGSRSMVRLHTLRRRVTFQVITIVIAMVPTTVQAAVAVVGNTALVLAMAAATDALAPGEVGVRQASRIHVLLAVRHLHAVRLLGLCASRHRRHAVGPCQSALRSLLSLLSSSLCNARQMPRLRGSRRLRIPKKISCGTSSASSTFRVSTPHCRQMLPSIRTGLRLRYLSRRLLSIAITLASVLSLVPPRLHPL